MLKGRQPTTKAERNAKYYAKVKAAAAAAGKPVRLYRGQ